MTFSDIVTVLGAGAGILVLLMLAAAPLLADLDPNPRHRTDRATDTPTGVVTIPTPRSPVPAQGIARTSRHAPHLAAG